MLAYLPEMILLGAAISNHYCGLLSHVGSVVWTQKDKKETTRPLMCERVSAGLIRQTSNARNSGDS